MLVLNKVELLFFFLGILSIWFPFYYTFKFLCLGRGVLDCLYFTHFLIEVMLKWSTDSQGNRKKSFVYRLSVCARQTLDCNSSEFCRSRAGEERRGGRKWEVVALLDAKPTFDVILKWHQVIFKYSSLPAFQPFPQVPLCSVYSNHLNPYENGRSAEPHVGRTPAGHTISETQITHISIT